MNGAELKEWRKLLGLTQEQAAQEFEVTRATIQNWEYEITTVPVAVDLASRQILRRWKRRLEFGPVTLVYTMSTWAPTPNDGDGGPTLFCKRYPDNKAALLACSKLKSTPNFLTPLILDDAKSVIWSGTDLFEECDKTDEMR